MGDARFLHTPIQSRRGSSGLSSHGLDTTYYARDFIIRTHSIDDESIGIEQRNVGMLGSVPVRYKERFGSQRPWVTAKNEIMHTGNEKSHRI